MKIGIDIDGVILDFERTMQTYAELYDLLILKKSGKINNNFSYLDKYDWTIDEKNRFINNYLVYATINSTPLIPLVKEMLEFFEIEGYSYEFITARGSLIKETQSAIIVVFKKYGIDLDNIHFQIKDKVAACKKYGIDIMIDDNPDICLHLQQNKINTLYFRDKNSIILNEDSYLHEVTNIGEIIRYIVSINGLNNCEKVYQKLLKK